jgi:hypothetical protein
MDFEETKAIITVLAKAISNLTELPIRALFG